MDELMKIVAVMFLFREKIADAQRHTERRLPMLTPLT